MREDFEAEKKITPPPPANLDHFHVNFQRSERASEILSLSISRLSFSPPLPSLFLYQILSIDMRSIATLAVAGLLAISVPGENKVERVEMI